MFKDFWHESGNMMDKLERKTVQRNEAQSDIYNIPDGYEPKPKAEKKESSSSWWMPGSKDDSKKQPNEESPKQQKTQSDWQIFDIDEKPKK
jgi:hypothetical protein